MSAAAFPLIGAGVGATGGIASTAMQNAANKDIAQMNNAFNEKMLDKQISYNNEQYDKQLGDQWKFYNDAKENSWSLYEDQKSNQWDMFNAINEYNSASAQRQRLEAAGLNPYMMMNGGSSGVAQSVSGTSGSAPSGSSPSSQGINPPTATPYSADYSGIVQGLGQALDTINSAPERSVKNAQADNLRIEGKYIAAKSLAEVYSLRANAKTNEERLALDKVIASIDMDLKSAQIQQTYDQSALTRAQTKLVITQTLMDEQNLKFLPQVQKLQLAQGAADIAYKKAQKNLTDKQTAHEIEKLAETVVRANGQQLQNQFDSDTYRMRVRSIRESVFNAIYGTDKLGIAQTGARFLESLGVPTNVE